jgi:hypothetical protein
MRAPMLLAVLALAACADPAAVARHQARLNALIGASETDLVRQIGVPSRSFDSDGHRFLAYSTSQVDIWPASPLIGFGRYGYGYGGGFPPQVVQWRCDTTFELVDEHVVTWKQRGNNC